LKEEHYYCPVPFSAKASKTQLMANFTFPMLSLGSLVSQVPCDNGVVWRTQLTDSCKVTAYSAGKHRGTSTATGLQNEQRQILGRLNPNTIHRVRSLPDERFQFAAAPVHAQPSLQAHAPHRGRAPTPQALPVASEVTKQHIREFYVFFAKCPTACGHTFSSRLVHQG